MKICSTCQRTYPDDFVVCPREGTPLTTQATATEAQLAAGLSRRFRIVRRLGQGGMGAVFLAQQITVGDRPVALKVLNRKLLDDPDFLMRFQNEAGSTGRISHANVVTIYESSQADDGTPFIAMQFLEGESLGEALKGRGALPINEAAEILQQAARGLHAAHKLGIIHRDIKPDNIFLTRGDEGELVVKVVDFGIAKLRESSSHTQTGMVLGTPAYMSYEQASGMRSDELDARSDIYSLGVVAYEMLSGRVPFHSDTPVGYLRKHLMDQPPPFRAIAPGLGVPPAVESAVMKALVKDRGQRYASVIDFARAFTAAAQPATAAAVSQPLPSTKIVPPLAPVERMGQSPSVRPQASKPPVAPRGLPTVAEPPQFHPVPESSNKIQSSNKIKYIAVAVLAVILVVTGVWYFSSSPKSPAAKPQVESGQPQAGPAQPSPAVIPPAPTSPQPIESGTNAADARKQVEAAKREGGNYYANGEYDNAIGAYQRGLRLDPSNAQLLKALQRAQTAKAAEEKVNQ